MRKVCNSFFFFPLAYRSCSNDVYCAGRIVENYMSKFRRVSSMFTFRFQLTYGFAGLIYLNLIGLQRRWID